MSVKKCIIYLAAVGLFAGSSAHAQLMMTVTTNDGIEAQVDIVFADAPQMVVVARCESGFRQFTANGSVVAGGSGGNYIGVFQISSGHAAEAQSMGMDIYTTDGNLAYARYLYQKQGTSPWSGCVRSPAAPVVQTIATVSSSPQLISTLIIASAVLTQNLKIGMTSPQVAILQQLLNTAGFPVAVSGPGSPGHETILFGALTRQAVKNFQCKNNIVCSGTESTTGYGRVGSATRAVIMSLATRK